MLSLAFADPRSRSRAVACLIAPGALLLALTAAIPGRDAAGPALAVALAALAIAAGLAVRPRAVGEWTLVGWLLTGVAMVTALVALSGALRVPDAIFYVWAAPMSFFVTGRRLVAVVAGTALMNVGALLLVPADAAAVQTTLMTVASLVALSVWLTILRGRLEAAAAHNDRSARTDPLTRIANRVSLVERAGTLDAGAVLLLFDLDGFKAINDRHGHAAGDQVLRAVAARLRASVRPGDAVARLGGDEFAVLLTPGSDPDAVATRALARLREPVPFAGHSLLPDASVGTAVAAAGDDLDALLAAADARMYTAKRRVAARL